MPTRREFAKAGIAALAALPLARALSMEAAPKINSTIHGVSIGLESFGLLPYPQEGILDFMIGQMVKMGIGICNLQEFLLLPPDVRALVNKAGGPDRGSAPASPDAVKAADDAWQQWRTSVSPDSLREVRKKFDAAGINLYGLMPNNLRTLANSTDEDLHRLCETAQALGVGYVVVLMSKSAARRFVPFAEKYKLKVGFHGRSNMQSNNPDSISTPADYLEVVGLSKNYAIHLDIGNATSGGYDVPAFVKENHAHIQCLAIKDRTVDRTSKPWGEGDSHVKEVLQLVRDNKYPITCLIDCDYPTAPGTTRMADIQRCLDYAKTVLAT